MQKQIYIDYLWNILITIVSTFLAIFLPLNIILGNYIHKDFSIYITIIQFVFAIDILFNLLKYRYFVREYEYEPKYTIKSYLQSWFSLDLISLITLVFFSNQVIVLLALIKLLKVLRFMHFLKERELKYNSSLTLLFFVFWTTIFAHWISCGWLLLQDGFYNNDVVTSYIRAIYWCVTTLTTIGYGDITPINNIQMIYTIFVQVLGVGVFGYLIANIAGIVAKKDPSKVLYLENMERLAALIKYRKIPLGLQKKLRDYYNYVWKQRLGYDEVSTLEGLPTGLKTDLSLFLKREVLEKIPLFNEASIDFIKEIAMHISPIVLTPGDYVFKAGDEGKEMFFVVSGELLILDKDENNVIAFLKQGDYFGELALIKNKPRTATIKAVSYCDLYTLNKEVFTYVVNKFPDIGEKIENKIQLIENS